MLAQIASGAVLGVDAYVVHVEVDLGRGLPGMHVVGLPESAVREGRERVLAALVNSGFKIPPRRITINLAPADVPKSGSAFDLPSAVGIVAAMGAVPRRRLEGVCVIGELGLDGAVRPVRGVLPIAARCREDRFTTLLCPAANATEAAIVRDLRVIPVASLMDAVAYLSGRPPQYRPVTLRTSEAAAHGTTQPAPLDFADVKGQLGAKRALEIAAAGRHNVLMIGPPGSGKSMLARRTPGILPPLSHDEAIEVTKIYSVVGGLRSGDALLSARPFRSPHHTVSDAGLVGGGNPPRPGEASLAHTGVLFLDELPEFRRNALESLRQPLEDGLIVLGRARITLKYPARFTLIAAMNPCPCGFHGIGDGRCTCSPATVERYMARMSGPLLDRIDIHIEVPALSAECLRDSSQAESTSAIRDRVLAARERQLGRGGRAGRTLTNADLGPRELATFCSIDASAELILRKAVRRHGLSARAYHRVLRVARTIADLVGSDNVQSEHVAEAVQYRSLDTWRAVA